MKNMMRCAKESLVKYGANVQNASKLTIALKRLTLFHGLENFTTQRIFAMTGAVLEMRMEIEL
jgi:hypothetical protein